MSYADFDFVGMPTCVRNMEIKKVLKVAVVKMINDLMSVYQVRCRSFNESIPRAARRSEYGRCLMEGIRLVARLYSFQEVYVLSEIGVPDW